MNIHIEFCVKWNYGPEFDRVSKQIKKIFPHALVEGNRIPPRSGAFEITLNKVLVFSKFKSHRFPMENELKDILSD